MDKNALNVMTYGYLPMRYWKNWFGNIGQFFRNIKYAHQRVTRGYCDQDLWDLDSFYSTLFYKTLTEFANTTHSYPGRGEFADKYNDEGERITNGYANWQFYIREMAEHFYNCNECNDDVPINQAKDALFDKMQSYIVESNFVPCEDGKCSRLVETYSDKIGYERTRRKWLDKEKDAWKFRDEEKNKAFEMMSKNFFNLWD